MFRNKRNIEHQASSPHRHHQNTVEREIQTLIGYVGAVLHGPELLRADAWERAATHWVNLANDLPITCLGTSPNAMVKQGDFVDAQWQYRFAFGDLVCFHIDKIHRTWKFDTRNEVGFYMGDKKGVKGTVWLYRPYRHDRLLRDDVHRIPVSDVQLLTWYGRREEMRQAGLPYQVVRDAFANLLPSYQFEERENTKNKGDDQGQEKAESTRKKRKGKKHDTEKYHEYDDSSESDKEPETEDGGEANPYDTIVLPVETRPLPPERQICSKTNPGPRRHWGTERSKKNREQPDTNGARRARSDDRGSQKRSRPSIGKTPLEIVDEAMQKTLTIDEYVEHEARIMYIYRMLSMSDPDMPDTDEPVDAREALVVGPLKDKYLETIRSEWENLRKKTLVPVSKQELEQYVSNGGDYEKIGLTMKTKMKLKPDGTLDKFKGR